MGVATWLDMEGPQWEASQVQRLGRRRNAGEGERQWTIPLPYEIEQSLLFLIDEGGWMLRGHGKSQRWGGEDQPPWKTALCRRMGAHAAQDVEVPELWHGTGEIGPWQMQGAEAILTLGGDAIVEDEHECQALASRSWAMRLGKRGRQRKRHIASGRHVKWRGRETTRVRTVVIVVYDNEARSGDGAAEGAQQQRGDGVGPREEDQV